MSFFQPRELRDRAGSSRTGHARKRRSTARRHLMIGSLAVLALGASACGTELRSATLSTPAAASDGVAKKEPVTRRAPSPSTTAVRPAPSTTVVATTAPPPPPPPPPPAPPTSAPAPRSVSVETTGVTGSTVEFDSYEELAVAFVDAATRGADVSAYTIDDAAAEEGRGVLGGIDAATVYIDPYYLSPIGQGDEAGSCQLVGDVTMACYVRVETASGGALLVEVFASEYIGGDPSGPYESGPRKVVGTSIIG